MDFRRQGKGDDKAVPGKGWIFRLRTGFSSTLTWLAGSLVAIWAQHEARAEVKESEPLQSDASQAKQASDTTQAAQETQQQAQLQVADEDLADEGLDDDQLVDAETAGDQAVSDQAASDQAAGDLSLQLAQASLPESEAAGGGTATDVTVEGSVEAGAQESPAQADAGGAAASSGGGSASSGGAGAGAAAGGGSSWGLAALLPLAAAGGGGGGGGAAPVLLPVAAGGVAEQTSQLDGRAIDGYVKGATVFYDANGNGVRDAGEASATTGANGSYTLNTVLATGGRIIMQAGGVDVLTGQHVGTMVAPAGYTGINPFTMLLACSPGLTEAQLKAALGMNAGISLDQWDPIVAMQSADASLAADAQAAFIKSQQIFAVVQAASALLAQGHGATAGLVEVSAIAGVVADAVAHAGAGNDWNQTLAAALDAALAAAMPGTPDAQQQLLADTLKSALSQLLSTMQSSMGGLATALQSDDPQALAASMAAVAVAQDVLLDAAQTGNLGVLSSLADPDSLARLLHVYETALADAASGEQAPVHVPVLSLAQASAQFPDGPWILADSAANLAAKAIQQHGPSWFDSAIGVVVLDSASVEEASLLLGFANLSFVSHGLNASGAQSLAWDDYQAMHAAGLHPEGDTDLNLRVSGTALPQIIPMSGSLHAWGIRHLDVDGNHASIGQNDAAALFATGLDFNGNDHITLQVSDANLGPSLNDLHYLGVDQISGTAGESLHVSFGHGAGDALPVIDSALNTTLHLVPGELDAAVASASQLSAAGIDLLDNGGYASLPDVDAHALAAAGLAFVLADHVGVQAEGTVLQSSLSDLQHLAVDEVGTSFDTLHLNAGSLAFASSMPRIHPAANVVLHLQAAQLGTAIDHANALNQAGIDQIDVDGTAVVDISDVQAAALAADGLSFVAGDMVGVHAGGTHLQNSLHDLQHLGVDQVHSEHGVVVLQHGGELDALQGLPAFDAELDVSLVITPAHLSRMLLMPHAALAASHIDHLHLSNTAGSSTAPPTQSGQELNDTLAASGADLVLEGDGPLALTDEQAARLLLAGRLRAEDSVDLTIVHTPQDHTSVTQTPDAGEPSPDTLELNLAQLAGLGADHVEHVQGATLLVEAGVEGVNLEQELQHLLALFPAGTTLFGDAQVSLDVGAGNVTAVSDGLAAELKLLGIDHLLGEDGLGHATDRAIV